MFYTKDTALPPFFAMPKFLFEMDLSINAKVLYALLLARTQLSQQNGWLDEKGRIYALYAITDMAHDMDRGISTVKNTLVELENAKLLYRVRHGWNAASRHYLMMPEGQEVTHSTVKNQPSNSQKITQQEPKNNPSYSQNLAPNKKEDYKKDLSKKDKSEKPPAYGSFSNVFLSVEELALLKEHYKANYLAYIEKLSVYMASKGVSYRSHYATIKGWIDADLASGKISARQVYEKYGHYEYEEGELL